MTDKSKTQENLVLSMVATATGADGKDLGADRLASLISLAVRGALAEAQGNQGDPSKSRQSAVVSRAELKVLTGLSETTLWRLRKAGDFPAPTQLSARRVGWRLSEIEAWLRSRRAA